jgi:hypothetical protein
MSYPYNIQSGEGFAATILKARAHEHSMTQRWIAIENNDNQDLHPENVEISLGRGQPKLIRFGIFGPERVENFPMVILNGPWLCTCTG